MRTLRSRRASESFDDHQRSHWRLRYNVITSLTLKRRGWHRPAQSSTAQAIEPLAERIPRGVFSWQEK